MHEWYQQSELAKFHPPSEPTRVTYNHSFLCTLSRRPGPPREIPLSTYMEKNKKVTMQRIAAQDNGVLIHIPCTEPWAQEYTCAIAITRMAHFIRATALDTATPWGTATYVHLSLTRTLCTQPTRHLENLSVVWLNRIVSLSHAILRLASTRKYKRAHFRPHEKDLM